MWFFLEPKENKVADPATPVPRGKGTTARVPEERIGVCWALPSDRVS